jgi:hypothetical protein
MVQAQGCGHRQRQEHRLSPSSASGVAVVMVRATAIVRLLSDGARRGPVPRKERSHLVTAIIGMLAASSSSRASEVVVDEADGHGALPFRRFLPCE